MVKKSRKIMLRVRNQGPVVTIELKAQKKKLVKLSAYL